MKSAVDKDAVEQIKSKSQLRIALRRLKGNRLAVFGAGIIAMIIFAAIFAPWIAPQHYRTQVLRDRFQPPSWEYPLGTDNLGRCLFSRIIFGSRLALMVGVVIIGIQVTLGVSLGLIAGFYGGVLDNLIMRIVDIMLAFPAIVLALAVAAVLGAGLFNAMLALGVIGWSGYARVSRGQVLAAKENEYIEAARAVGASNFRIMVRHILPNIVAPIIVMATLGMAGALLAASALSFLGLGALPPQPCWGAILAAGRDFLRRAPWIATFPGIAIMITVLGFNFLGDGLRDALDPRQEIEIK
ncbi:ABC transporter permease [Candidatus Acetothermia bacterium]|jgi:peptide/nickel transport system permease protein|nr:ABC transporter permease [Candidatus Acetothermia bacterium]MCI2427456.1 ABC transporter permease [Candidatus Acetothermia bacterium]MCI2428579.1 ABC transporter permease [Candidatus Acetothermia bacterium]